MFYSSANIVFRSGWTAWTLQWWWQRWAVGAGVTLKRPGPWPVASPWAALQVRAFYSEKSHHLLSLPDQNSSGKDSDVIVTFGWLSKHRGQPTGLGGQRNKQPRITSRPPHTSCAAAIGLDGFSPAKQKRYDGKYPWLWHLETFSNHDLPITTCCAAVVHCLLSFSPCDLTEVCFLQRWRTSWTASCSCWATRATWRMESVCRWMEASWPAERNHSPFLSPRCPT